MGCTRNGIGPACTAACVSRQSLCIPAAAAVPAGLLLRCCCRRPPPLPLLPHCPLPSPRPLASPTPLLRGAAMALFKQSRLSVQQLTQREWEFVLGLEALEEPPLAKTKG